MVDNEAGDEVHIFVSIVEFLINNPFNSVSPPIIKPKAISNRGWGGGVRLSHVHCWCGVRGWRNEGVIFQKSHRSEIFENIKFQSEVKSHATYRN